MIWPVFWRKIQCGPGRNTGPWVFHNMFESDIVAQTFFCIKQEKLDPPRDFGCEMIFLMASFFDWRVPTDHSFSVAFEKEKCQNSAETKWVHSDKFCVVSDPDVWKVIRLIRRVFWSSSSLTLPKTNVAPPKKMVVSKFGISKLPANPYFPGGLHSLLVSGRVRNKHLPSPSPRRCKEGWCGGGECRYTLCLPETLRAHSKSGRSDVCFFCFFFGSRFQLGSGSIVFWGDIWLAWEIHVYIMYIYIYIYIYI